MYPRNFESVAVSGWRRSRRGRQKSLALVLIALSAGCAVTESDGSVGVASPAPTTGASALSSGSAGSTIALTNVAVVDVETGAVRTDRTVVIEGDRIGAVGTSSDVDVPTGARLVDGTGGYLIPGLWDMHTHNTWNSLDLFIANGVTGVREMGASGLPLPEILALRRKVRAGEVVGPRFVATGPTVDGRPSSHMTRVSAMTPEQGRRAVDSLTAAGADFIKVYELSRDTYFAIAEQAAQRGISIAGHLSPEVTLEEAGRAGQRSIEHYTRSHPLGLLPRCSSQPERASQALDEIGALDALPRDSIHLAHRRRFMTLMVDTYDEERCRTELARLGQYETWHAPTLTMGMGRRDIFDDRVLRDPRLRYITPERRAAFRRLRSIYTSSLSEREVADFQHVLDRIIVNLNRANVGLLAGADAFDGHGFALHGELESLVAAGLTPLEALQTATINPARFLGREDELGTVEAGKLADLVLLDANPLDDIGNIARIRAVIVDGRLFDRAELDRLLEESETEPEPRVVPAYTIDQFMETVRIRTAALSSDGEAVLFTSDASGVPNAWTVPFAGGEPVQLTRSSNPIHTHGYFPGDERFLYSADEGGDERTHIFVRNPDGSVRDLTPGEDVRALFLGWSADGHAFFFATNERDPRRMDIYEMSLDGYERTLLYRNDRGARVGAISPDRRLLGYVRLNSNRDNDLFLYDRETGQEALLSSRDAEAMSFPHGFGADGRHLYYTTDRDSDFRYLVRYDVEMGEHQTVLRPEWDVTNVALSPAGQYVAAAVNVDARTEVHLLETATLEPVPLPSLPAGDITAVAFSRDERRLAFPVGSGRSPGDLYVLDLDEGEPRLLVPTLSPEIDPEHLVEPEVVRFASYDGLEIPGLFYQPHAASPDAPVPAMIWIHGGPGGQSRVGYDPLIQYLVNHGYAVYAINNRGSTGYGRSFEALDDRKHGEVDLEDVVASRRMLIDTGWIDPERIGVMGASYGGYLTMAALTFRPDTFAVGVNIYGVTNWIRSLEARDGARPWMQSGQKSIFAELGDPATDRDRLHRISPLFHADRITKPFLVLQGANDQRVLQIESDEIVAAARANGVPVEYIVFPDEGHGILKKENQRRAYEAVLAFLEQHLKGND